MLQHTLTLYLIAGILGIGLSVVSLAFSRLQKDARLAEVWALITLLQGVSFLLSWMGPELPRGVTVVGSNLLLLAGGTLLYSGFVAFRDGVSLRPDPWGLLFLAAGLLAFIYWGLLEPHGVNRSIAFSLAAGAINLRTATQMWRSGTGSTPLRVIGAIAWALSLWMFARAAVLYLGGPPPGPDRGANPTTWPTVAVYIALMAVATIVVIWMEVRRSSHRRKDDVLGLVGIAVHGRRSKLLLLWTSCAVVSVVILSELWLAYSTLQEVELSRLEHGVAEANDVFAEHTDQVVAQVDTVLYAVRGFYLRSRSVDETRAFVQDLQFDRRLIDNVYVVDPAGHILLTQEASSIGRSVADRDYFTFHRNSTEDVSFIGVVEPGRVTDKMHFRITRRVNDARGNFAGVIVATVVPEGLAERYGAASIGPGAVVSLIGTRDHRLRARTPPPEPAAWSRAIDSPLWHALARSERGRYDSVSAIDGVARSYFFRQVGSRPLVVVTGFSLGGLQLALFGQYRWVAVTAVGGILVLALFATLLTIEILRRDEQERFMSMLNHELKTPLSVIRMALGGGGVPDAVKQRVVRAVEDMDAIIERSVQADRMQQGRIRIARDELQVADALEAARAASSDPGRVQVRTTQLPACVTDGQLLEVILGNLLDNALKYAAPETTVQVEAHADGKGVRIAVANRPGAAGMPDPQRVFHKYYRSPGAHGKTGSGLGLHIADGFARMLGGNLRYRPGADTVKFELWIPQ